MAQDGNLLTITEASARLGVSKLTLRNWDNSGRLKAVRLGARGDRRYQANDIEALLAPKREAHEIDRTALDDYLAHNTFWSEEAYALPVTIETGVVEMSQQNSYFKSSLSHCIFLYENDHLRQFLSVEESVAACASHLDALHNDPESVERFFADCDTQFSSIDAAITRANFLELSKLSNEELNKEFRDFNAALSRFWNITLVVEPYAPFLDHVYYPKFKKEVADGQVAYDAFVALSMPTMLSFVSQERRDLLRLILRFLKSSVERKKLLAMSDADYLAYLSQNNPSFLVSLEQHAHGYFWVQNSYGSWRVLSIHDFLGFIRDIVKAQQLSDLERELRTLTNQAAAGKEQKALEKKLGLSDKTRKELAFIRHIVWIKDERKKHVLKMLHVMYTFLSEYSKRTNIPVHTLGFSKVEEMPRILDNALPPEKLEERMNGLFNISQSGGKSSFIVGNDVILIRDRLFRPHGERDESIHGTIACKGVASTVHGTVRVILDPRGQDIGPDDILVTSMTRPEFVPLMRKAKAIITDEGGITCHAAIVSREMNKPCIIGTRSATKLLQNGEHVEMRMNHGIIRTVTHA